MPKSKLFDLAGLALILGGIMRAFSSFAPEFLTGKGAHYLFLATDISLTLGIIGFYAAIATSAGLLALLGFAGVITATLIQQESEAYMHGALIYAVGMVVMGICAVISRSFSWPGPALWVASLVVGFFGISLPGNTSAFVASGLLFAAGCIVSGFELRKRGGANH